MGADAICPADTDRSLPVDDAKGLAEGIETAEQLQAVAGFGFDLAQGYHIARPSPTGDVADWLTSGLPVRRPVLSG